MATTLDTINQLVAQMQALGPRSPRQPVLTAQPKAPQPNPIQQGLGMLQQAGALAPPAASSAPAAAAAGTSLTPGNVFSEPALFGSGGFDAFAAGGGFGGGAGGAGTTSGVGTGALGLLSNDFGNWWEKTTQDGSLSKLLGGIFK